MDYSKFAQEVHQNALDHGFWDEEKDIDEIISLIHSEWSEALEELRAGRPMVWFECKEITNDPSICNPKDKTDCLNYETKETCAYRGKKPEGIAVELIDGCLRIIDLLGRYFYNFVFVNSNEKTNELKGSSFYCNSIIEPIGKDTSLQSVVCALHNITAKAGEHAHYSKHMDLSLRKLETAICLVFFWLSENGVDPEELIQQKHEFNKGRPYKHGKNF